MLEIIKNTTESYLLKRCPVEKSNVYLIEGECFAFDKTKYRKKDDTKAYCSSIFGEHLHGRIYEPRSRNIENAVPSKWGGFEGGHHWLGINDNQSEGTWRYDSDDSKIAFSSWDNSQPGGGTGDTCAYQYYNEYLSEAKWYYYPCGRAGLFALCELE